MAPKGGLDCLVCQDRRVNQVELQHQARKEFEDQLDALASTVIELSLTIFNRVLNQSSPHVMIIFCPLLLLPSTVLIPSTSDYCPAALMKFSIVLFFSALGFSSTNKDVLRQPEFPGQRSRCVEQSAGCATSSLTSI